MRHLSRHFTYDEMTRSQYASRHGIRNLPHEPEEVQLMLLCENVLEPVRALFGRPIHITSGYRSPAVNDGIGGSQTSQHMKGQAADFVVEGLEPQLIVNRIGLSDVPFDQLICEFDSWIHISRAEHPRSQMLRAFRGADGRTHYNTIQTLQMYEMNNGGGRLEKRKATCYD